MLSRGSASPRTEPHLVSPSNPVKDTGNAGLPAFFIPATVCSPGRIARPANIEEAVKTEIFRFDIEGQEVVCYQTGEDRLWRCECGHFERALRQYREAFCPHTAVAIMRFLDGDMGEGSD